MDVPGCGEDGEESADVGAAAGVDEGGEREGEIIGEGDGVGGDCCVGIFVSSSNKEDTYLAFLIVEIWNGWGVCHIIPLMIGRNRALIGRLRGWGK